MTTIRPLKKGCKFCNLTGAASFLLFDQKWSKNNIQPDSKFLIWSLQQLSSPNLSFWLLTLLPCLRRLLTSWPIKSWPDISTEDFVKGKTKKVSDTIYTINDNNQAINFQTKRIEIIDNGARIGDQTYVEGDAPTMKKVPSTAFYQDYYEGTGADRTRVDRDLYIIEDRYTFTT